MRPDRFLPIVVLSMLAAVSARAQSPLGTAFTYQGELATGGTTPTGTFDLRFRLYDAPTAGSQIGSTLCSDNLSVAAGRFAVPLDFGAAAFAGQQRFLEIEARENTGLDCSNASGYTLLAPRQELTPTPNATFAQNTSTATNALSVSNAANLNGQPASFFTSAANLTGTLPSGRLSGAYTGPLSLSNPANIFTGIRKDAWAEKNRIPNSVDKIGREKGKYLHPEAFDKPASQGINTPPAAPGEPGSK